MWAIVKKRGYIHLLRKSVTTCLLLALACLSLHTGCSTNRNTAATRAYHELTTRYNIYFNAEEAYHAILQEQTEHLRDNYDALLPFYPTDSNTIKSSPGGPFDAVVEKTEKAIREHSITAKPRRNPAKAHSREYRQWLRQEEFNPFLKNVWMLRGKALLQNGDYDEALAVFSGMTRRFSDDTDMVDEAEIWMLRVYTGMGREYDAEKIADMLKNKRLPDHLERLFTEHYTYFLLQKKAFTEAIAPLRNTISQEPDHNRKKKLQFLLGQIYAATGEQEMAARAFEEVKGLRTPPALAKEASRWQLAMKEDSLAQVLQASLTQHDIRQEIRTAGIAAEPVDQGQTFAENSSVLPPVERTLAESAAMHRQFRSRNVLWRSLSQSKEEDADRKEDSFSIEKNGSHYLLLIPARGFTAKEKLLFTIADFNFSHFKHRLFNFAYSYLPGTETIQIEPFHSFEETDQYSEMLLSDSLFVSAGFEATPLIISEENLQRIDSDEKLQAYKTFYAENMAPSTIFVHEPTEMEAVNIEEKNRGKQEKIVSLDTMRPVQELTPDTTGMAREEATPARPTERESPEALRRRLEENAAKALLQEQKKAPRDRRQLLKEREKLRKEKIRQRERRLREREREREAALRQREREREQKIKKDR